MIAYAEIESESAGQGVSPETLEKDYHLDWYLASLGTRKFFPEFSFYGGTAIKKLYVPHHRFSEDIDLISAKKLTPEEIGQVLDKVHAYLESEANLFYFFRREEAKVWGTRTRFMIHYRGFSQIGGIKRFLLDFAQGIEGLPSPVWKILMSPYRDLKSRAAKIQALPLEIICAQKLALILDQKRKEPRDLYDLWSVFARAKGFNRNLFLSYSQKLLSALPEFPAVKNSIYNYDFKKSWEIRLRHQVPHLPDFELAAVELLGNLEKIFG